MKRLKVTVDGRAYDVIVEVLDEGPGAGATPPAPPAPPPVSATIAAPAAAPAPRPHAAGAGDVVSPLAGKLVSIDVKVGQDVQEGTHVATIEAMKMNTHIHAPRPGRIVSVHHNPGDAVEEGSVILRIA